MTSTAPDKLIELLESRGGSANTEDQRAAKENLLGFFRVLAEWRQAEEAESDDVEESGDEAQTLR